MIPADTIPPEAVAPSRAVDDLLSPPFSGRGGRGLARDVLLAAVWIALVTGWLEVSILGVRKLVLGEVISLSQHFVWMAPLAYVMLYVPPALALAALATRMRRLRLPHLVAVFAFLSAVGVGSMFPRLHRLAIVVLAAGVAVQAARLVASREVGFVRMLRRSVVPLAAVIPIGAWLVFGTLWAKERRAVAAVGSAAAGAPNVLLIILDTVRAASMGLYGYDRPTTPNLERLARRGVVFDRALSTSPWTLPSHGTMFTGRYPHELTANYRTPLDDRFPTLAEVLVERGYVTAGFVANPFYASYEHGLDRGFVHYEDYPVTLGQTLNSASLTALLFAGRAGFSYNLFRRALDNFEYFGRKNADDISGDFLSWLDAGREAPYFAFLNYMDAHVPYTPPAELASEFGVRPSPPLWHRITRNRSTLTEEERRAGAYDRNRYDASIAAIDRSLGALFDTLERRGALENTLVIITSDHGEHLGENGIYSHANSLYMPNLHVPLLLWMPGRVPEGGLRIAEMVTLRSLPATILELVGASDERRIPGASLAPLWRGGQPPADPLLASVRQGINMTEDLPVARGDLHSLTERELQFIRNPDSEELYDLSTVMRNERDLAGTTGAEHRQAELRAALEALVGPRSETAAGDTARRHP
ncbi:MAG TPA: sulfatase [Gemmatimonadaceae bacterium]|nr:sulfatase [Gemmatimonadaceae bacterium]